MVQTWGCVLKTSGCPALHVGTGGEEKGSLCHEAATTQKRSCTCLDSTQLPPLPSRPETSVGTGDPDAHHAHTGVGDTELVGWTLPWLKKVLKWKLGGRVSRKGKQNITGSPTCYNKHRAATVFCDLDEMRSAVTHS